jgi:hypothetical protein
MQFCKGLAEYRQGHYAPAADWMRRVLQAKAKRARRTVEAYAVLAMAEYRENHPQAAHAALANAIEIAETEMPSTEHRDLTSGFQDWLIAFALIREAKTLIPPEPAPLP